MPSPQEKEASKWMLARKSSMDMVAPSSALHGYKGRVFKGGVTEGAPSSALRSVVSSLQEP